jgi:2''-aminoglycoside nucleotidyltransferase
MAARVDENGAQVEAIRELFTAAEARGLLLWLESGWAIDARLGRIARPHEDIDVAFPKEREGDYRGLLEPLGYAGHEQLDYGFLSWRGRLCIDSEPCYDLGGEYGFLGFPPGACPQAKEGVVGGFPVRCLSWEAIYFEILGYIRDIPESQWRPKDFESLRLVETSLDERVRRELQRRHAGTAGPEGPAGRPHD